MIGYYYGILWLIGSVWENEPNRGRKAFNSYTKQLNLPEELNEMRHYLNISLREMLCNVVLHLNCQPSTFSWTCPSGLTGSIVAFSRAEFWANSCFLSYILLLSAVSQGYSNINQIYADDFRLYLSSINRWKGCPTNSNVWHESVTDSSNYLVLNVNWFLRRKKNRTK